MDRGRSETGRKIGEVKKVKKVKGKLGGGERQGGAQGWRRGAVCFQTISHGSGKFHSAEAISYSIAVFASC